jgi:hypothetical protein
MTAIGHGHGAAAAAIAWKEVMHATRCPGAADGSRSSTSMDG